MIVRLSKKMAAYFAINGIIKSEDVEVYEYGLQILLSTICNGIIAVLIALVTGTFWQCVCYLTVFILLRKSAGGFHAKTHLGCCCILAAALGIFILFIRFVPVNTYAIISAIAVVFSTIMIAHYAPLEHKNKPIHDKDRKRLRRNSIIYTVAISVIIFVLGMTKHEEIMVCLSLGMLTATASMFAAVVQNKFEGAILKNS